MSDREKRNITVPPQNVGYTRLTFEDGTFLANAIVATRPAYEFSFLCPLVNKTVCVWEIPLHYLANGNRTTFEYYKWGLAKSRPFSCWKLNISQSADVLCENLFERKTPVCLFLVMFKVMRKAASWVSPVSACNAFHTFEKLRLFRRTWILRDTTLVLSKIRALGSCLYSFSVQYYYAGIFMHGFELMVWDILVDHFGKRYS